MLTAYEEYMMHIAERIAVAVETIASAVQPAGEVDTPAPGGATVREKHTAFVMAGKPAYRTVVPK